jgi:hypothetical protein
MKLAHFATTAAVLLIAVPAFADSPWEEARGKTDKTVASVKLDISDALDALDDAGGQLNFADITAEITQSATIVGSDAATAAVTAAAIGNSLTSELAIDTLQGNFASVTANVAGSVSDASVTAAAIGNSASLTLSNYGDTLDQVNTGRITATISGSLKTAQDTTAAAIGNSLSIVNSTVNP